MHRATPANSSFRAYSAGGARALLSKFDDLKGVQQVAASFMKGEARKGIEHVQQYGFTSVPFEADKPGEDGKPGLGPETFMSFAGGNRSFPMAGPIDDRRHRMRGLSPGDVALFSSKDSGQQLHLNGIGSFWSSFPEKPIKIQLVQKPQQVGQGGDSTFAEGDAASGQIGSKEELGQKPVYKMTATASFEVSADRTESVNVEHTVKLPSGVAVHISKDGNVYLGGLPSEGHTFSPVLTVAGPSSNVFARTG